MSIGSTFGPKRASSWLSLVLVLGVLVARGGPVRAQSCHGPVLLQEERPRPFHASLALLTTNYEINGYAGNYQGAWATVAYRTDWYGAEVLLPAYRLDHAQGIDYGLGDLMATLRANVLRRRDGDVTVGVELPIMVPTGDVHRNLGMGNVMLMPAVYLALTSRPLFVRAQLGYGYMFGPMHMPREPVAHPTGERIMSVPLVNPMNMSELEHALMLGVRLPHELALHARAWGAVPVHSDMGVLRQAVAVGASIALARYDVTLELQRAVAGSAFEWKPFLQLGAAF